MQKKPASRKINKKVKQKNPAVRPLPKKIKAINFMEVVWKHLTEGICNEVFETTRDKERQRKWTLFTLLRMWMGLLQSTIGSQTAAVEACGNDHPLFPKVEATPESFFMRIQNLRPVFFKNIFSRFTRAIEPELQLDFQTNLSISKEIFPEIYAVDGSRLSKVGHLLKITRSITKAIIPGSMEALYDLRRGYLKDLWFDPDGARSELGMFQEILKSIKAGVLLLADRYYPKPIIWRMLADRGIWMVSRYNASVGKQKLQVLRKMRNSRISIDDWIVEMGAPKAQEEPLLLRWVRVWNSEIDIILVTNVLDHKLLTAEQLLELYSERWSIERMYLHLKEVLALNRLFNASPAAVGQQVYATAILYNALRLSQAQIARKLKIPPELLSPEKLFPRIIEKYVQLTWMELGTVRAYEINNKLGEYDGNISHLLSHPSMDISIEGVLVEKRTGVRKKPRFCKGRKKWTTYKKIPGGKKFLVN